MKGGSIRVNQWNVHVPCVLLERRQIPLCGLCNPLLLSASAEGAENVAEACWFFNLLKAPQLVTKEETVFARYLITVRGPPSSI